MSPTYRNRTVVRVPEIDTIRVAPRRPECAAARQQVERAILNPREAERELNNLKALVEGEAKN